MTVTKTMQIEIGAREDALTTFARDQLMALRCADEGIARARVWRRRDTGLLLGRFHRADPASFAPEDGDEPSGVMEDGDEPSGAMAGGADCLRRSLSRRLSGGRIVPVGPGVVCITMAAPVVDWFDPASKALRPEQVLNRALRPLLAMLRGDGVDAFYSGRDLVTAGGRTIAHASFTVMRDGVAVVEMHVAEAPVFPALATLLDRDDPAGIAGVDREALANSTSLEENAAAARSDDEWAARLAKFAASSFACEARVTPDAGGDLTMAHASAARSFLATPGPAEEGVRTAAAVAMLGVVECSGRMRGDRLTGLRITGDLIAPFHTLDDIAAECEGEVLHAKSIRSALARAMAKPRSFLLGLRDLDELILRLA